MCINLNMVIQKDFSGRVKVGVFFLVCFDYGEVNLGFVFLSFIIMLFNVVLLIDQLYLFFLVGGSNFLYVEVQLVVILVIYIVF